MHKNNRENCFSNPISGPLFINPMDVLLPNLAKSQSRKVVIMIILLWNLASISAAVLHAKYQSKWKNLNPNLGALRLHKIWRQDVRPLNEKKPWFVDASVDILGVCDSLILQLTMGMTGKCLELRCYTLYLCIESLWSCSEYTANMAWVSKGLFRRLQYFNSNFCH